MKYEQALEHLHQNIPAPFNGQYRPGFREMLDVKYTKWSESHPGHTRSEGMEEHSKLVRICRELCPSIEEQNGG